MRVPYVCIEWWTDRQRPRSRFRSATRRPVKTIVTTCLCTYRGEHLGRLSGGPAGSRRAVRAGRATAAVRPRPAGRLPPSTTNRCLPNCSGPGSELCWPARRSGGRFAAPCTTTSAPRSPASLCARRRSAGWPTARWSGIRWTTHWIAIGHDATAAAAGCGSCPTSCARRRWTIGVWCSPCAIRRQRFGRCWSRSVRSTSTRAIGSRATCPRRSRWLHFGSSSPR